jgi:hypothetical protein
MRIEAQPEFAQHRHHAVAAALVDRVVRLDRIARSVECSDRHLLDRLRHPAVEVRLHPPQGLDHGRAADGHGDPPAGHVEGL